MGPFTYYTPLWLGTLISAALLHASGYGADWSFRVPLLILVAAPVGLACQLAMFGAQGAFAQVLPVPIGKSIRGRPATVCGSLTLLSVAALSAAFVLALDDGVNRPIIAILTVGGIFGVCALGTYVWSLPVASRDFTRR
jgi:hypothetical protein